MKRFSLRWQLTALLVAITGVTILALCITARSELIKAGVREAQSSLLQKSIFAAKSSKVNQVLTPKDAQILSEEQGEALAARVTYILKDGTVTADSKAENGHLAEHSNRPEVKNALLGRATSVMRYSTTLERDFIYAAAPIIDHQDPVAVIRLSVPLETIVRSLESSIRRVYIVGGLCFILIISVVYIVGSRLESDTTATVFALTELAAGNILSPPPNFSFRAFDSIWNILRTLRNVVDKRADLLASIERDLDAILMTITDGVILVDSSDKIIRINGAARNLLDLDKKNVIGLSIPEAVFSAEFQRFVRNAGARGKPLSGTIAFHGSSEKLFQISSHRLKDFDSTFVGTLFVFSEVTHIRRLENVRSDFVANVSHELKTPVTSIKGFVETLLGGGVDDEKDITRFLGIISAQTDRLHAIIEDLLSLSRLEEGQRKRTMHLVRSRLRPIIEASVRECAARADARNISLVFECSPTVDAYVNPGLLEQALVNLIDNAIKYSLEGGRVEVIATEGQRDLTITVQDNGIGIEKKHLSRIFERFYRVDKGRSRDVGGTGLGLSIVKHIAQAHGGFATVESHPGKGSAFSIHLTQPAAEESLQANGQDFMETSRRM
ncbi:MAG: ATP-binding protein [Bdellovibrionales bacterium]|nr:ATP-binding protein [Bdellovibrionales bacterium]